MSHFLFVASNNFQHPRLSLISLRKITSFNQDLHCESWLVLPFLRSEIRERQGWLKCDTEVWSGVVITWRKYTLAEWVNIAHVIIGTHNQA